MAKLLRPREVIRALQRAGFVRVSQRGSHIKLKKQSEKGEIVVIVPNHPEIAQGTLDSILVMAGLSREEMDRLL